MSKEEVRMSEVSDNALLEYLTILKTLEESKVPLGTKSIKLVVTDSVTVYDVYDPKSSIPSFPWISFALVNTGPNEVKIGVNGTFDLVSGCYIPKNGELTIDMVYPVIKTLYLQSEPGGTANVKIRGKIGKDVLM